MRLAPLKPVPAGVRLEHLLPLHRDVDFARWHGPFLNDAVRDHYSRAAVKEVKHPIVDPAVARSQLINLIPEVVRLWAAQLVAELLEALKTRLALLLSLGRNLIEPLNQRYRLLIF